MLAKEELVLIVYFIVVILLLSSFAVFFFIIYQKRKNTILKEKYEAEQKFKNELAESKIEIQENTLKNVAWELHDNIGQLLSVASIQVNLLLGNAPEDKKEPLGEVKSILADSLKELRSLSKSLNREVIGQNGLQQSVQEEIDRLNRMGVLEAEFSVNGDSQPIPEEDQIILFRIIQEFISNVIKHAKAEKLHIQLNFNDSLLKIKVVDNGIGFEVNSAEAGSGLLNMKSRAKMIQTDFELDSHPNKGTSLYLQYPLIKKAYEQNDSNR